MVLMFPPSFANRLEQLRQIQSLKEEKSDLQAVCKEKEEEIENGYEQIERRGGVIADLMKKTDNRLELAYSMEVEQLKTEVKDLNGQIAVIVNEKESIEAQNTFYKVEMEEGSKLHIHVHAIETQKETYGRAYAEIASKKAALVQKHDSIHSL